jgi:hypothetical protein
MTPFLVTGCVGAGTITTRSDTTEVGRTTWARMCPSKDVGELMACKKEEAQSLTAESFSRVWGEPKYRGTKDSQEYWIYNRSVAWRGLLVYVVFPIPLLLPVGHNETTLYFEHGKLIRTVREDFRSTSAVCGLHSEGPDGFGCVTSW